MNSRNRYGSRSWHVCAAITLVCLTVPTPTLGAGEGYRQQNLISDVPGLAAVTDPQVVNSWGINVAIDGTVWVSNAGSHTATAYRVDGRPGQRQNSRIEVQIPQRRGAPASGPTGVVANYGSSFVITANGVSAPAKYLFANLDGTINAWNDAVDPSSAIVVADRSAEGAVYTGITMTNQRTGNFIVAANFAGRSIDVFNGQFQLVASITDPDTSSRFSPFNVQEINGQIFVALAQPGDDGEEETGPGLGAIAVIDIASRTVRKFTAGGTLNAPWGMVFAPSTFGELSNLILVGNFGDGRINAFDPATGAFKGQLLGLDGQPVEIEGLWGLAFGAGKKSNVLLFAAGINDEENGLVGALNKPRGRLGT